jgi:uncharacterized protein YidB (DUF937 family)
MGLLEDVLSGLGGAQQQQRAPSIQPQQAAGGGMSPVMMAMVALLAQRALRGGAAGAPARGGGLADVLSSAQGSGGGLADLFGSMLGGRSARSAAAAPAPGGGGLGDLLGGLLGGASGGAGNALAGGLGDLMRQFDQTGHGEVARSWVGRGPNQSISPNQLADALGPETVHSLAEQAGVSEIDLLSGLSRQMPGVIDRLTPDGRLPTAEEASRWV